MSKMEVLRGRTALLLEAARAASSTLHLDAVLATTGRGIATAADVQGCLFYLADEEGDLVARPGYIELDGVAACEAAQINRRLCQALDVAVKPIIERVQEQMIPLACDDAPADLQSARVEPLGEARSFLAVPCLFDGRLEAIALAFAFGAAHSFTVEETELSWGIANVAAPAIAHARLHEKAKSLAAREERVRLAQEMHDTLAQVLATLSLKADSALDLLEHDQIEETQADLRDIKLMADDAFSLVREEIFGLRAFDSLAARWLPTLREYLEDYLLYFGLDVRLMIQDESAADLPDTTSVQVFRIIQEALTNVRRHAKATQAWVSFQRQGDGVRIEIGDDGVGFDLAQVMQKMGVTMAWRSCANAPRAWAGGSRCKPSPVKPPAWRSGSPSWNREVCASAATVPYLAGR
jgi:signal transduction histidine kinase